MQQRVTPKPLIAENKRRDYGRVRNHLKVILSDHITIPQHATKSHSKATNSGEQTKRLW